MPKSENAKLAAKLRRLGFDKTYCSGGYVRPKCSQCCVMVINGVACHETGCLNSKAR